ncbi:DUF6246 family protein [Hafnia paralvei]|uniref:DUF6246 family protein n=1 Tax=Hafnia paralvei TaxID=546367 RepID=UPI0027B925BE|nr:DUF6246 family protein [Hafnia paralvei]
MTPLLEIGEMVLTDTEKGKDFFFRPSLLAMTRIGSPSEIVRTHALLVGFDISNLLHRAQMALGTVHPLVVNEAIRRGNTEVVYAAMNVMQACCEDDITPLIGELKGWKHCIVRRRGGLTDSEIVIIARELLAHGVIGKAKIRRLQRNESKSDYSSEFSAADYIVSAQSHFGLSRGDAEQLTMTMFQMMLKNKYPEEKGFTREEYNQIADSYLENKKRRIAMAEAEAKRKNAAA